MTGKNKEQENISALTDAEYLYEYAPCGHLSLNAEHRILRINERLCEWLAVEKKDMIGQPFSNLLNKAGGYYYQMFVTPLLNMHGAVNEINLSMKSSSGTFDVLFNAISHKNEQGAIYLTNSVIQKISDRKKYEQELLTAKRIAEAEKRRFEFLSNTVPNIIWTASPEGRINFVNERGKAYFATEDLLNVDALTAIYAEDREAFWCDWKSCLQNGESFDKEVRLQPASGEAEWFVLRAVPFHNEKGQVELWFGSCTNIHKQKQLHMAKYFLLSDRLETASKKINEDKGVFQEIAFSQSHRIRKPVANILGLISILNQEALTDEGNQVVQMILESVHELDKAVKQVINKSEGQSA